MVSAPNLLSVSMDLFGRLSQYGGQCFPDVLDPDQLQALGRDHLAASGRDHTFGESKTVYFGQALIQRVH